MSSADWRNSSEISAVAACYIGILEAAHSAQKAASPTETHKCKSEEQIYWNGHFCQHYYISMQISGWRQSSCHLLHQLWHCVYQCSQISCGVVVRAARQSSAAMTRRLWWHKCTTFTATENQGLCQNNGRSPVQYIYTSILYTSGRPDLQMQINNYTTLSLIEATVHSLTGCLTKYKALASLPSSMQHKRNVGQEHHLSMRTLSCSRHPRITTNMLGLC